MSSKKDQSFYSILFMLLAIVATSFFFSSCNESLSDNPSSDIEATSSYSIDQFIHELGKDAPENNFEIVDDFDGKTVADFYREWVAQGNSRSDVCGPPPSNCIMTPMTGIISLGPCDFSYSYDLYDCGFGNVVASL